MKSISWMDLPWQFDVLPHRDRSDKLAHSLIDSNLTPGQPDSTELIGLDVWQGARLFIRVPVFTSLKCLAGHTFIHWSTRIYITKMPRLWFEPYTENCSRFVMTHNNTTNNNNNNNNDNNERISRAPSNVKHAQLRWRGANTKMQSTCIQDTQNQVSKQSCSIIQLSSKKKVPTKTQIPYQRTHK